MQKVKVKGQSVQNIDWIQTDGKVNKWTDGWVEVIALLMWSVKTRSPAVAEGPRDALSVEIW